ncbi:MAG: hypothetical protein HKN82_12985 [Akkermansiaceae bacterium]|nr:hypothetical protein [Akkermansiaceae bacterium]NNM28398.1 hypothetical protein [Akkermansiaceae bacterium]
MTLRRMRAAVAGIGAAGAVLAAGCGAVGEGGAPPSLARPFIDHPAKTRISYRTEEAAHLVSLFKDGTYLSESTSVYGEPLGRDAGRWSWKKTGSHGAELRLGSNTWTLTFASPDSALAVNLAASGRTHAFQFERM